MKTVSITCWLGAGFIAAMIAGAARTYQKPDSTVDLKGASRLLAQDVSTGENPADERSLLPGNTRSSGKDNSLASRFKRDGVVNVGGQVRAPGPYPFTPGLILYAAIQCAGGATEFGSMKRVIVTRKGKRQVYDLTDPKWTHTPLIANDTIEVPQKNVFGN